MKVSKDNPNVQLVYTSISGTNVYAFVDVTTSISAHRGVAAEEAKRFASMNITKQELSRLITAQKVAINTKKDFVEAFAIMQEIEYRLNMVCEEKSLLELAYIFFMIEGEDDELPSLEINQKKQRLANDQMDLKAFFLRSALELAGNFSKKQDANLLTYLEETRDMSKRIYRFISQEP